MKILDGLGNFSTPHIIRENISNGGSIFPSDIDGDGDIDLVTSSEAAGGIGWLENIDGSGSSWIGHGLASGQPSSVVFAADINNDNFIDVLWASSNVGNGIDMDAKS